MENYKLKEIQSYVKETLTERGFDEETLEQKLLLLVEEVGELAKAVRKSVGMKIDNDRPQFIVADEVADCLMYLIDISNKLDIDIEDAFWSKEEKNKLRTWS